MHHSGDIIAALTEERNALAALPRTALLINGLRMPVRTGRTCYRFEVPDNFVLAPGTMVRCSVGTELRFAFPAVVADVQSQFAFLAAPAMMGERIPELHCEWDPAETVTRLLDRWTAAVPHPLVQQLADRLFPQNALPAPGREPLFPSTFSPSQLAALKESLGRRISFVIGERYHGKTGVAAAFLFNMIREGKRVLYLASSSHGLHGCMHEAASLNPAVAEESIAIIDAGLDLQPELPVPHIGADSAVDPAHAEGLRRLFTAIFAEEEYRRIADLDTRVREKQRQIEEASAETDRAKQELNRLQSMSMMERVKLRNHKTMLDDAQGAVQHKTALVERLRQQVASLTKEQFRKETALLVPLKERRTLEPLASLSAGFAGPAAAAAVIAERRCVATTLTQALQLDPSLLQGFDAVCIDDAHALNLAEFFYVASLARERCCVLADITEQPPQSAAQTSGPRAWLQKSYFHYLQDAAGEERRFTTASLPSGSVSVLTLQDRLPTLFDACLAHALDGTAVPANARGRVHVIDTSEHRAVSAQYIGKKKILPFNEANGRRTVECVKHALMHGAVSQHDVVVVTPPSGQSLYLREPLRSAGLTDVEIAVLGAVRLCVKRAMVLDLTVAGLDFTLRMLDERKTGLVRVADTFNTLLSTVRDDLYVVADLSHFRTRYKDRFVTRLLDTLAARSENASAIAAAARRFDDLPAALRRRVASSTAAEKQTAEYRAVLEQHRLTSADPSRPSTGTIAVADRKLRADIHAATLRVLAKRDSVNTVAQYLETAPLYRTSVETQQFAVILPDAECENENDFKGVMNMWNLLIYETSNAHRMDHPLASKAKVDARIAAEIQQMYAYYHSDLEMVVEEGKHKLAQSVQKIFNDCIGKKPVTPADWKSAYLVFLARMEKYLDTVIAQIRV